MPAATDTPKQVKAPPGTLEGEHEATPGAWADTTLYQFRLDLAKRCGTPERLAVKVRIVSKADQLFVSPRDVTIEHGGVILQSLLAGKSVAGCPPLLETGWVPGGKQVSGAVLFEVPLGFAAAGGPLTLAYTPTRWGGAGRAQVKFRLP